MQAIEFAIREWVRQNLRTCVPGIIRAYDARTMRARVQPALNAIIAQPDGSTEALERAPIYDVPVIWPGGGGFVFHAALVSGDTCWMMFSERGIGRFKESLELADPPPMVMFASCDAVALPWRTAEIVPVEGHAAGSIHEVTPTAEGDLTAVEGAILQSVSGETHIHARGETVRVKAVEVAIEGEVTITGNLEISGGVTNAGTNIGRFHRHGGVQTGPGQSGFPV